MFSDKDDEDTSPQTPNALRALLSRGAYVSGLNDTCTVTRRENGISTVVAMTLRSDPSLKLVALGRCYDCYNLHGMYMVKDHVWEAAWPDHRVVRRKLQALFPARVHLDLCLNCLILRLGRDLTLDDLTDKPINDLIVIGYALGRAHGDSNGR